MKKYDVVIIGGGTAGCACAWNCGKLGLSALLLEKSEVLGGTMTSGLVVPVMNSGNNQINTFFYENLISEMKKCSAQAEYMGNPGWFNPEILKIVLDKMLTDNNVDILFNAEIIDAEILDNTILSISVNKTLSPYNYKIHSDNISDCRERVLSEHIEARYVVDSTGNSYFSKIINCDFLKNENKFQPMSLRFIMSGIDIQTFSQYLQEKDNDRNVTTAEVVDGVTYLSTAYTWDADKHWALADLFNDAVNNNILKDTDRNYFQVFSVAGTRDSLAFNCPRVAESLNPSAIEDRTKALLNGRQAILRLSEFCKKYFPGFENAYISNISDYLGVRASDRIRGKYIYTIEDLRSGKTFKNPAVISNYPVDIHSSEKNSSTLEKNGEYQLPIESLMSYNYDNLYMAGRNLSADYLAQGALRVQASCFSMGEAVAKHIKARIT